MLKESRILLGRRTELAGRYAILLFLSPFIIPIPFAYAMAKDLNIPLKRFLIDLLIVFIGFALGPGTIPIIMSHPIHIPKIYEEIYGSAIIFKIYSLYAFYIIIISAITFIIIFYRALNHLKQRYP